MHLYWQHADLMLCDVVIADGGRGNYLSDKAKLVLLTER